MLGVVLIAILGLGTGLLPALQASRLKIVDALRRTG
jgi:ABC-type antimicrobial peptide transport system permease subunit